MSKEPLFVAVSNQKGGVGKSALTVVLASYFHFEKNLNVAIIDCDSPQHSLVRMRERDKKAAANSAYYQQLLLQQWERVQKKAYPIVGSNAEKAREAADKLAASGDYDLIFVDLPGTVESTGVFRTIVNMDYVLTPTTPDLIIMQSTLAFSTTVLDYVRNMKDVPLKDILFFWNRLKKRSNVEIFKSYSSSEERRPKKKVRNSRERKCLSLQNLPKPLQRKRLLQSPGKRKRKQAAIGKSIWSIYPHPTVPMYI